MAGAPRAVGILLPLLILTTSPADTQDIRGLEACMAEKQMDRRTGCLQANTEFLQQALAKQAREANDKINAASRELAAAKADIAALKAALAKLEGEVKAMKAEATAKKK